MHVCKTKNLHMYIMTKNKLQCIIKKNIQIIKVAY